MTPPRASRVRAVALLLIILPAAALAIPGVLEVEWIAVVLIAVIGVAMVLVLAPNRPS